MPGLTLLLLAVLGLALAFDYVNGFHDTANAIATSVSTRALKPQYAIALSATANFVGALFGTEVAKTVGSGLITHQAEGQPVVAAALVGAIAWNLFTWRLGIPSSSSHALIGGLLGAAAVAAGFGAWNLGGVVGKVLIPLVSSPTAGFLVSLLLMVVIFQVFRRAHPRVMNDTFRRLQVVSAAFMAFSHGSNDA
jgi:inorganic phosphate transporter, PiT family